MLNLYLNQTLNLNLISKANKIENESKNQNEK